MSEEYIDLVNSFDTTNKEALPKVNPYEDTTAQANPYDATQGVAQANPYERPTSYVYTSGWMNTNNQQPVYRQPVYEKSTQQSVCGQPAQQSVCGQPIGQPQYTASSGNGYYYMPAQYVTPVLPKTENKGLAIAGMVCGILSIVFCCLNTIAWMLAIPGLIMSIAAITKRYKGRGMAIAGVICSSLGLLLSIGFFALLFVDMM